MIFWLISHTEDLLKFFLFSHCPEWKKNREKKNYKSEHWTLWENSQCKKIYCLNTGPFFILSMLQLNIWSAKTKIFGINDKWVDIWIAYGMNPLGVWFNWNRLTAIGQHFGMHSKFKGVQIVFGESEFE